jgi:hypothetical protein
VTTRRLALVCGGIRLHNAGQLGADMIKTFAAAILAALFTGCAYSHVASTAATFRQSESGAPLMLQISRHLDTVVPGPDDEEDQLLALEVRDFQLNERLKIPSEKVTPEFTVTRFGPRSKGESFSGFIILRKITADQVDAYLRLAVTARTESGKYTQRARFRGNYSFTQRTEAGDSAP